MATDGFTLMTGSFYLRKPYLALPMHGQFERELNAFWMAKLKYGISLRRIRSEAVGNFLCRLPDLEKKLKDYQAEDNSAIEAMLGGILSIFIKTNRAQRFNEFRHFRQFRSFLSAVILAD